jgi:hypothetical protein
MIEGKRWAVIDALGSLAAWGDCSRAEVIERLRKLFREGMPLNASDEDWGALVCLACDLEAWELLPEMNAAFDNNLVDECIIDREAVIVIRDKPAGSTWEEFKEAHRPITDVALETEWLDKVPDEDDDFDEDDDDLDLFDSDLSPSSLPSLLDPYDPPVEQPYIAPPKVGRNDPCPCGSGKKHKKCCG